MAIHIESNSGTHQSQTCTHTAVAAIFSNRSQDWQVWSIILRPKFLHVCIPVCKGKEEGERGRAHKAKEQRHRKEKTEKGVQREDLSHEVEQQKQGKEMDKNVSEGYRAIKVQWGQEERMCSSRPFILWAWLKSCATTVCDRGRMTGDRQQPF